MEGKKRDMRDVKEEMMMTKRVEEEEEEGRE